jgi:hypothetical protein
VIQMAATKILMKDWGITIDGTAIAEIKSMTVNKTKTDADTTTFDSNGNAEHLPALRGATIQFEGMFIEDDSTGARDAGQAKVVTQSALVGAAAIKTMVLTSPAGTTLTFDASFNIGTQGGGNTDPTSFNFEATVKGAIVEA